MECLCNILVALLFILVAYVAISDEKQRAQMPRVTFETHHR